MKKIVVLICIFPLLGYGQVYQALKPLEGRGKIEQGIYYKDLNNVFGSYQGTYEYVGNDFYLKIVLNKISMIGSYFYEDMIVGQYKYVKNGVTIDYLNDSFDANDAKITSSWIKQPMPTFCSTCLSEKWIVGDMFDPSTKRSCTLYIAKKVQNGETGIQVQFYYPYGPQSAWEADEAARLPKGQIFMRKVN